MTESDENELPSENFFKALTGDQKTSTYSIVCGNVTTDSSEKEINKICTKLANNIYYLENVRNDDSSLFDKHCYDLNYWLYHELTTQFGEGEKKIYIYPFFEEIQKQWNNIDRNGRPNKNGKICKPQSQLFKTGLFKSIKKLLDYFENFQTFEQKKGTQNKESNKYCDNIKECVPLYFTFKKLCQLIKNDICAKYLQNNDRYDPKKLLSELACVQEGSYEDKLDKSLVTEVIKTYQSGFGNVVPDFGSIIPGLGNLFTGSLQGMFMNPIYNLIQQGLENGDIETLFNRIKYYKDIFFSENFQKYGLPSIFVIGLLILFFFFFIIYKCCGCLLRCCIFKRKKKVRKHLSDLDTSELMSAPLGFPAPMMPMNPYALRYQLM